MRTYTLLNGKKVDLAELSASERAFLGDLRRMARAGISYFEIERTAIGPGSPALRGWHTITPQIASSPLYAAAGDIATRAGIEQGLILAPQFEHFRGDFPRDGSHISTVQAAHLIGISRAAVHKAIKAGKIDVLRIGNVTVVDKKSAIEYRQRRESAAEASVQVEEASRIGRARSATARAKRVREAREKVRTADG